MDKEAMISEIEELPETLQQEVIHYISALKKEHAEKQEVPTALPPRIFGVNRGKYQMAPDFDDPLKDFNIK